MSTPKIAFHSGLCCGIKIIHGLGEYPEAMAHELVSTVGGTIHDNADQYGHDVSSTKNFFTSAAPEETYIDRIDRYIKFIDAVRPNGIIEIALAEELNAAVDCADIQQVTVWEPLLLPRGFEQVTSCYNSNSGNHVFVFHRKTDKVSEHEQQSS